MKAESTTKKQMGVCAFCGLRMPVQTPDHQDVAIAHIKECPNHPIHEVEKQRDKLLEACKKARCRIIDVFNLHDCADFPKVKLPHYSQQKLHRFEKWLRKIIIEAMKAKSND